MSLIAARSVFTPRDGKRVVDLIVQVKIYAKVRRSQAIILEEAVANVAVDTGELRDSIAIGEITIENGRITGTVVATADHAGYNEFGTGRRGAASPGAGPFAYDLNWPGMVAHPFMRPGLDAARNKVMEEFSA